MIDYPLSPIRLGGFRILSFAVDFGDGNATSVPANRNVSIEFNVDATQEKNESGVYHCECVLSLVCDISTAENDDSEFGHLGRIDAKLFGVASARFDADESDDSIGDTLEANAISFLYGKARTYIELITAFCPGGVISLPAIMPTVKSSLGDGDASE